MKWFSQHLKKRISANPTKNKPKLETLSERKTWTGLETVECGHPPATGSQEPPQAHRTLKQGWPGLGRLRPTAAAPNTLTHLTGPAPFGPHTSCAHGSGLGQAPQGAHPKARVLTTLTCTS